jgi:spermidine synthase
LTFFEINPAVERLARDPDYFTYLRDCAPEAHVVVGDARLSLERVRDHAYDLLIVDAFSSDAIPVHLMTSEAVSLYLSKLSETGLLVLHISNRYVDLAPVIAAIVQAQGLAAAIQRHRPDAGTANWKSAPSQWVVVGRRQSDLQSLLEAGPWEEPVAAPGPLWTDDYSNVVRLIKR